MPIRVSWAGKRSKQAMDERRVSPSAVLPSAHCTASSIYNCVPIRTSSNTASLACAGKGAPCMRFRCLLASCCCAVGAVLVCCTDKPEPSARIAWHQRPSPFTAIIIIIITAAMFLLHRKDLAVHHVRRFFKGSDVANGLVGHREDAQAQTLVPTTGNAGNVQDQAGDLFHRAIAWHWNGIDADSADAADAEQIRDAQGPAFGCPG
mmetsp:Transcript_28653/g.80791  ORF Transcript_28653/g.80791 Transcript_28653/m.80791 type:complete len:206 (-) Transcript_28653:1326-1943(-)